MAGVAYAWAMLRRGKIGDAVIAHATTNALLAAYVLLFQKVAFVVGRFENRHVESGLDTNPRSW